MDVSTIFLLVIAAVMLVAGVAMVVIPLRWYSKQERAMQARWDAIW